MSCGILALQFQGLLHFRLLEIHDDKGAGRSGILLNDQINSLASFKREKPGELY